MNEVEKLILMSKKTAKELSLILGVPSSRISEYKNGKYKITVQRLKEWCALLNINIKDLF